MKNRPVKVVDGKRGVLEYAGCCDRWLAEQEEGKNSSNRAKPRVVENNEKPRKLLNKEKEALIELPKKIEKMEAERDQITAIMQSPDYYRNPKSDPSGDQESLEKLEKKSAFLIHSRKSSKPLLIDVLIFR